MEIKPEPGSIRAIARDPHTIFVYWDSDSIGSDKLTGKPGANVRAVVSWILRLYCADNREVKDFEILPESGRYYFHGLHSGYTYLISMCQVDTMGDAHCLLRCDEVALPQAGFSGEADPEWAVTPQEILELVGPDAASLLGSSDNFLTGYEV